MPKSKADSQRDGLLRMLLLMIEESYTESPYPPCSLPMEYVYAQFIGNDLAQFIRNDYELACNLIVHCQCWPLPLRNIGRNLWSTPLAPLRQAQNATRSNREHTMGTPCRQKIATSTGDHSHRLQYLAKEIG